MKIETGREVITAAAQPQSETVFGQGQALFDARSTSATSSVFAVRPNTYHVITAYGLADDRPETVDVYKIAPLLRNVPSGGACDSMPVADARVILAEAPAVTDKQMWRLGNAHTMGVIAVPGYYRLKLSHESMIGQAYVVMEIFQGDQLPKSVVFGGQ